MVHGGVFRSLMSYEQRFEALKVETAKLKQEAEAFESNVCGLGTVVVYS